MLFSGALLDVTRATSAVRSPCGAPMAATAPRNISRARRCAEVGSLPATAWPSSPPASISLSARTT
eukprot:1835507-Lingulodinium_polyedra.AAC.1